MKKVAAALTLVIVAALALIWWWPTAGDAPRQRPAQVVNIAKPIVSNLAREIEAVGTAQARESITVTSEVDGRLEKVVVTEGQSVKAGQPLFLIDDRTARAQLARADAQLADAQAAWRRAQQLKSSEVLSRAEADTLQAALNSAQADRDSAAAQLANYQIKAPFSGVLGLRQVNQGSYVKAGDRLTTLDDLDHLEVLFAVPERYLGQIKVGQRVDVRSISYPDKAFSASVRQLDTRVDPINRTVTVKAILDNSQRKLLPGQFLAITLRTGEHQALMIPEQAIVTEGAGSFIYVVEDSVATRREIQIDTRQEGWVEVLSGVAEHDNIVINGHTRLGGGAPVEVREDAAALQLKLRPEAVAVEAPSAETPKEPSAKSR
jgi:membrane fusion protein, multidrug efflux system